MPVPLTKLLSKCQQGLAMGFAPQLAWDGTGGTYVLRDASRAPLAAFKPRDEEAFAPNNPRGLPGKLGQPAATAQRNHSIFPVPHRRRKFNLKFELTLEVMHAKGSERLILGVCNSSGRV